MDSITNTIQSIARNEQDKIREERYAARHIENIDAVHSVENAVVAVAEYLTRYLDSYTGKTEVTNPITSVSTPDIVHVVQSLRDLTDTVKASQTDTQPIVDGLSNLAEQIQALPHDLPEIPEQREEVKVSNLNEIYDFNKLEKAIKGIKFDPKPPVVNVPETQVNVAAPDLSDIQKGLLNVVKAVKGVKLTVPETDLSKLEKEAKKQTKLLTDILSKPVGGGGGGASRATPYENAEGIPLFVQLTEDGKIPVEAGATSNYESRNDTTTDTNLVYLGKALPGSATSDAAWQIKRYNKSAGHMSFADDVTTFTKTWDDRTSYSY